jgi:hypothetical protein
MTLYQVRKRDVLIVSILFVAAVALLFAGCCKPRGWHIRGQFILNHTDANNGSHPTDLCRYWEGHDKDGWWGVIVVCQDQQNNEIIQMFVPMSTWEDQRQ